MDGSHSPNLIEKIQFIDHLNFNDGKLRVKSNKDLKNIRNSKSINKTSNAKSLHKKKKAKLHEKLCWEYLGNKENIK